MAKRNARASLDEPTPEAVQAAAKKLFYERVERQRAEREAQARQRAKPRTFIAEEDQPQGRDWSIAFDSQGRVRHW